MGTDRKYIAAQVRGPRGCRLYIKKFRPALVLKILIGFVETMLQDFRSPIFGMNESLEYN